MSKHTPFRRGPAIPPGGMLIDPNRAAQAEELSVFRDPIDTKLFRQRVKENVAGLVDRFL